MHIFRNERVHALDSSLNFEFSELRTGLLIPPETIPIGTIVLFWYILP